MSNTNPENIGYNIVKLVHNKVKIVNSLHKECCKVICQNGGDILEIGFGAGVTADFIQQHKIESHTIVEIDNVFYGKLLEWVKNKPNVRTIKGNWLRDIPENKKYDGIFIDVWDEGKELTKDLYKVIKKHSKNGTIFVSVTMPIFDKELFINDKDFMYEEIEPTIKLKWYHLLSRLIRFIQRPHNQILSFSDKIRKVTYKG